MSSRAVVLLACGSYNPPTPMHLRMFEIARDHYAALGVAVLGGIVSPVHDAYGKTGLVPAEHRRSMLRLALNSSDWIRLSDWEINNEGWTKTRIVLQYHQNCINAFMRSPAALQDDAPSWMPRQIVNMARNLRNGVVLNGRDEVDGVVLNQFDNGNEGEGLGPDVRVKLLCGGDLLESFSVPGLWAPEDLEAILRDHGLVVITRSGSNPEKFVYDSDALTLHRRNISLITNWVQNEVSSTMVRRLLRRKESVKYLIDDGVISYIKMHNLYGSAEQTIKYLSCDSLKPCITTPSPNDIVMKSPSEFRMERDADRKTISSKIINYLIGVDETDKNDVYTGGEKRSRLTDRVSAAADPPPRRFGSTDSLESARIPPRKTVKVITDVSGVHKIVNGKKKVIGDAAEDVFVFINCKPIDDDDPKAGEDPGAPCETPKSPRSYDEVVKFIFSEHGIQVISDRETIV